MGFAQHIDYPSGASTLGSAYTASSGSVTVATGTGSAFGAPTTTNPVRFTMAEAATPSACCHYQCTGRSSDTLTGVTVLAGTDQNFAVGDTIFSSIYAEDFNDLETALSTSILTVDAETSLPGSRQLVAGANITLTDDGAGGTLTIAAEGGGGSGTVTSVAMTGDGTVFAATVTGSPITSSGTLEPSLAAQAANAVLAGPSSGSNAAPTFRALATADLPDLTVAIGGTGQTSLTAHAVLLGEGTSGVGFATVGTAGRLLLDQGSGSDPAFEAMSGDATLSSSGAITVAKIGGKSVSLADSLTTSGAYTLTITCTATTSVTFPTSGTLVNSAVATLSSLTSVGTIATGTWEATPIGVAYGGTGDSSLTAYAVLCGGTTSTGALQQVSGLGTSGYVLTSNGSGALPTWQAVSGSGTVTSVAMTGDGTVFASSVTGSPITSSGTLEPSLAAQAANAVLAGPSSGSNAAPTFRALGASDLATSNCQSYTNSSTSNSYTGSFTIPANAAQIWLYGLGGGGSGGSGAASTTTGTELGGGGAGAGGGYSELVMPAAGVAGPLAITITHVPLGGAGVTSGSGNAGSQGSSITVKDALGNTIFTVASGNSGGGGTTSAGGSGGSHTSTACFNSGGGGGGGYGSAGGASGGGNAFWAANGGGGGGGLAAGGTTYAGSAGGAAANGANGGAAGTTGGGAGGAGTSGVGTYTAIAAGGAGGGGGSNASGNGGAGGAGGNYGGGGGGGGASATGTSGAGGQGGQALLVIAAA